MASNSTGKGNSTGKWVERAATTGGGRTYRGQMPVNWYASLAVICIVGLLLIGFSRYQRTHQTSSSAGPPTTSQMWYAGLGIDICGTMQPDLPASTNTAKTGLTANGNGVITIAPKNSSESGSNATLGKFVSGYKGLELTSSTLQYPGKPAWNNGDVCPKGTPDAGKPGVVIVDSWPSFTSKGKGTETSGPPAGPPVRQRPADHHGLRAGHGHGAEAPGPGHHQPDHRVATGSTTATTLSHHGDHPAHHGDHGADHFDHPTPTIRPRSPAERSK